MANRVTDVAPRRRRGGLRPGRPSSRRRTRLPASGRARPWQLPRTLERPHRPAEAGLDDEILDEAVRALRGDRDEMTPGRVRDPERQLDELLSGAGEGHAQVRFARSPDHQPGISRAGNDGRLRRSGEAAGGTGEVAGAAGAPLLSVGPEHARHKHGNRHVRSCRFGQPVRICCLSSRCAGRVPTHPDYTDRGSTVPGLLQRLGEGDRRVRPRALSIRYIVSPSVQASASPPSDGRHRCGHDPRGCRRRSGHHQRPRTRA